LVAGSVREADSGCEPLTERSGGDLDTIGVAVFGVSRSLRAPRTQRLEVVEFETKATEVELYVLREGGVTDRKDETVATEPIGVGRVVAQDTLVEEVRRRSETHRRTRVTVADLLHGIRRKDSGGIYRASIDLSPLEFCHGHTLSNNYEGARIPSARPHRHGQVHSAGRASGFQHSAV